MNSKLQFHKLEDGLTLLRDNVCFGVDEVTFFIDDFTSFVSDLSTILMLNYVSLLVFIKDTNYIVDIESPAL